MNIFGDLSMPPHPLINKRPSPPIARAPGESVASGDHDGAIKAMWRDGLDTYAIAESLRVHQSVVANRLAAIRDWSAL